MSIEQLQAELASLPQADQDRIAAYLAHLRQRRDPSSLTDISRKLDDQDSDHWLTLEQLEDRWKE